MRPTVIAYRLLQPVKERRTSTTSGFDLRSVTRAATLFTFCGRGDSPLARDEADGPRTTCSGGATPSSLFPVRALRARYVLRTIHLDDALRRRLPVALAAWAEGPSEGSARLRMMRECPSSATLVHPSSSVRSARGLECPHVRWLPPIETPVTPPFREEERLFGDQGAFHRQQSAVCTSIARCDRERIGLPSRRSDGRSIAKRLRHRSRWG